MYESLKKSKKKTVGLSEESKSNPMPDCRRKGRINKCSLQNGTFSMCSSATDPDGSWTGVPENAFDEPIQDADDL